MSSFKPNKRHLRELLIYFFNLMKSAAEAHRLLVEAYGEAALSERSCREWYQRFKNGEFDIEDKKRSGRPKVYEDAGLKALLYQDSCQTQEELALTLGVTQQAISHRLQSLGMIQKQGNWVPYELTPRNVAVAADKKISTTITKSKSPLSKAKKTAKAPTKKTKSPKPKVTKKKVSPRKK